MPLNKEIIPNQLCFMLTFNVELFIPFSFARIFSFGIQCILRVFLLVLSIKEMKYWRKSKLFLMYLESPSKYWSLYSHELLNKNLLLPCFFYFCFLVVM